MVECARRYRQPPEACQPRDCESRILLPIARARCAPCVGPSDPYSGTTNKVGDLGLWWGCTKELWAWPHPWGVAGAKIETAWGYSPGEGVCTRSHMAHAGHTLTGPKPDNWISCRLICDACEGNAHPLSFLVRLVMLVRRFFSELSNFCFL